MYIFIGPSPKPFPKYIFILGPSCLRAALSLHTRNDNRNLQLNMHEPVVPSNVKYFGAAR